MYNHRRPHPIQYRHKSGKIYNKCPSDIYTCSTYSLTSRKFDRQCSQHHIRTVVLRELALDAIREVSGFVKRSRAAVVGAGRVRLDQKIFKAERGRAS